MLPAWPLGDSRITLRSLADATRAYPAELARFEPSIASMRADRFVALASDTVSLDRVKMFHFNDTQIPLGGNKDRHWHIGDGLIGFDGFRAFAAHPELGAKTAILETPGEGAEDARNMQSIRAIFDGSHR